MVEVHVGAREVGAALSEQALFGAVIEVGDAEQAYPQAKPATNVVTWLRLPLELQPAWWSKFRDPVVPMDQNLYGHPDAGGWWEKHAEEKVLIEKFEKNENMPSMFWHPKLEVLLIIYVDDFKMSGRASRVMAAWGMLRKHIKMGKPETAIRFLGIHQQVHRAPNF